METLQSHSVQRAVLRHLVGAGHLPEMDWQAVQEEILGSGWVHRVQKLQLQHAAAFRAMATASVAADAMDYDQQEGFRESSSRFASVEEQLRERLSRLQVHELQECREAVMRLLPQLSALDKKTSRLCVALNVGVIGQLSW